MSARVGTKVSPTGVEVDEQGYEVDTTPVTAEEKQRMVRDITNKCISLTELLQSYQASEQQLKELIAEFAIRDIEEENAHIALTRQLAMQQGALLRNAQYVRWAAANGKGEFAVTVQTTSDATAETEASVAATRADAPRGDVSVPPALGVSGPCVGWMCGWRKAMTRDVKEAVAAMQACRDRIEALANSSSVVCVNGTPLIRADLSAADDVLRSRVRAAASPEQAFVAWRRWCIAAVSGRNLEDTLAFHQEQLAELLSDDGSDLVAFIPALDCALGVRVRAIVVHGQVRGLESLGPFVNMPHGLQLTKDVLTEDAVLGRVRDIVEQNEQLLASAAADHQAVAVTLLVSPVSVWLLHVCKLTPELPFDGRFTWQEVCNLGRIDASSEHAVVKLWPTRAMELPVDRTLSAHDAAWMQWLNDARDPTIASKAATVGAAPLAETTKQHPTTNAAAVNTTLSYGAAAVAVGAAAAVGLAWLRTRRQS